MTTANVVIAAHRQRTEATIDKLRAQLDQELAIEEVFDDHTTFILTGSAGRGEMTPTSDIDGYVLRVAGTLSAKSDEVILKTTKAALKKLGLPPPDKDGEHLKPRLASLLTKELGTPEDDATGALTTRMLFLLESVPLCGAAAYTRLRTQVIAAYRNTVPQRREDFLPFFLVNDIIRYWRTVLLNHEARLRAKQRELAVDQSLSNQARRETLLAHRRYWSQKLRFPRCITCFSTLAYLLAVLADDEDVGLSEEAESEMFEMTPLERLEHVGKICPGQQQVGKLLQLYANYLERSKPSKSDTIERLVGDAAFAAEVSQTGSDFTEEMFHLIQELGRGTRLHRQMLI